MERLSISSFQSNGHPFHLYVYQQMEGIPPATIVKDANEILPSSAIFTYREYETYAGFANFFRYKLLLEKGGWFVDLDTICLKPFEFAEPYVFTSQLRDGKSEVNLAAMKMPSHSEIMRRAWDTCRLFDTTELRWGQSGPELIARGVNECDLGRYVQGAQEFCPVHFPEWRRVLEPGIPWSADLRPQAVHLWNEMWRRAGQNKDAEYDSRCLYEQLKGHYLSERKAQALTLEDLNGERKAESYGYHSVQPLISAVILTRNGARRLPRCIASIQRANLADEIVICVDRSSTDDTLEVARLFTRHVYELETKGFIESVLPRMASLCSGEFVLRVDDDECIAGNWDKEQFQMLFRFNGLDCAWVPRRWVVPPGNEFITSSPWFPDLQLRLFRNDPDIITWPQKIHEPMKVAGGSIALYDRWLEHFDSMDRSREERELKCKEYLRLRPETDLSSFYLWEECDVQVLSRDASGLQAANSFVAVQETSRPIYRCGAEISFRADGDGSSYTLRGWSTPESSGTWTDGKLALVRLPLDFPLNSDAVLEVKASAFVRKQHPAVYVEVLYRQTRVGDWSFDSSSAVTRKLTITAGLIGHDRRPVFRFQVINPMSPFRLGESDDRRLLGLALHSLKLVRVTV
jgi:hypothetical protein